jgi:hypothetical protein
MTALLTLTDDTYSANSGDSRKRIYATVSLTNPYTAGGELIASTLFANKLDGGRVIMVNPSVAVNSAGIASTGILRGDNASVTGFVLQFFNPITTQIAGFVDNTVANLSNVTCFVELIGR